MSKLLNAIDPKVIGIFVLLVVLCVYMSATVPESFLKTGNIENLIKRTSLFGILGIGVAFVIITSGIDLSIGSMVCLSACLLTIYLRVTYDPIDKQPVLQVSKAEKRIYLPHGAEEFSAGTRLRYYGGRRAKEVQLTVTGSRDGEYAPKDGPTRPARILEVDQAFNRDDTLGQVARIYKVLRSDKGKLADPESGSDQRIGANVTIEGDHGWLQARDQITLIDPGESNLLQLVVARSEVQNNQTTVHLTASPGDVDISNWVAIPVRRNQRMPIPIAILSVLLVACMLGATHGLLVTKLDIQPFIVTLCGLLIYRGISRYVVNNQVQGFGNEYETTLSWLTDSKLPLAGDFGIPYTFFILLVVAVAAAIFLNKTIWGRYMLAVGRNEEAARYSGIDTHRVTILAYVICTAAAALAGMLFALDSNSVSPSQFGNLYELYAIAAAVLGGCSLRGGEGGILGVLVGTALMRTLRNLIVLKHISDELEFAIIGLVILIGVVADVVMKRWINQRRAAAEARRLASEPAASEPSEDS